MPFPFLTFLLIRKLQDFARLADRAHCRTTLLPLQRAPPAQQSQPIFRPRVVYKWLCCTRCTALVLSADISKFEPQKKTYDCDLIH